MQIHSADSFTSLVFRASTCGKNPFWSSPSVDLDAKRKIKPPFAWSYVQAVRREAYDGPQWSAERGAASVVWFCPACGKSSFGQSAAAIFGGDGDRPGDWGSCASFQDCQGGGRGDEDIHAAEKRLSRHLNSEHWSMQPVFEELRSWSTVQKQTLIVADLTDI